jgi:hypothetical protein
MDLIHRRAPFRSGSRRRSDHRSWRGRVPYRGSRTREPDTGQRVDIVGPDKGEGLLVALLTSSLEKMPRGAPSRCPAAAGPGRRRFRLWRRDRRRSCMTQTARVSEIQQPDDPLALPPLSRCRAPETSRCTSFGIHAEGSGERCVDPRVDNRVQNPTTASASARSTSRTARSTRFLSQNHDG